MARSIEYQPNNGSCIRRNYSRKQRVKQPSRWTSGGTATRETILQRVDESLEASWALSTGTEEQSSKLDYAEGIWLNSATSFDEQRGKNKFPFSLIRFFGFSTFFLFFFFSSPLPCSRVIEEIISHELSSEFEEVDSFKRIFREGESVQFPKEISFHSEFRDFLLEIRHEICIPNLRILETRIVDFYGKRSEKRNIILKKKFDSEIWKLNVKFTYERNFF